MTILVLFTCVFLPHRLDQMFTDAFGTQQQLVQCDVKGGVLLACALLARGSVTLSDIRRNLDRWAAFTSMLTNLSLPLSWCWVIVTLLLIAKFGHSTTIVGPSGALPLIIMMLMSACLVLKSA